MPFLVRKLNRPKWEHVDLSQTDDVTADVITRGLKTDGNTLSVWQIDTEEELDLAILAIVTGSRSTSTDSIDVVLMDETTVKETGIALRESNGDTAVDSLIAFHRDLINLTYNSLGLVRDCIVDSIRSQKAVRISSLRIRKLLAKAIREERLQIEKLNENLRPKAQAALELPE